MADRYYICIIVGTGTEANPYRAKVADGENVIRASAVIKSNPDGTPARKWTIARVDATDFTDIEAMTKVFRLGSRAALNLILTDAQKQWLKTRLQQMGEDVELSDIRVKHLILRLIKKHYPRVVDVLQAFP